MNPVLMFLWSTLQWTFLPQSFVVAPNRSEEIIYLLSSWKLCRTIDFLVQLTCGYITLRRLQSLNVKTVFPSVWCLNVYALHSDRCMYSVH